MKKHSSENLSRRDFIINSTGGGFAALLLACGIKRTAAEIMPVSANSPIIDAEKVCLLTRERTEGPFYISGSTIRRNIRENSEGKKSCSECKSSMSKKIVVRSKTPSSVSGTAMRAVFTAVMKI